MARWNRQIEIKQFFDIDEYDPKSVRDSAKQIFEVLKVQPEYGEDDEFTEIADQFEVTDGEGREVNWVLEDLYDWADANRVWIGGDVPSTLPSVP